MNRKKLVIGITAPQSIILLKGQLKFMAENGFDVYLLAPETEETKEFCEVENATLLPINIEREIDPISDINTLLQLIRIFRKLRPDIVNLGTPKVSLLGMIAAKLMGIKKRIYTCRGFRFEHEAGRLRNILVMAEKITSRFAHRVIAISESVRELGIKENIFDGEKCVVIHKGSSNGVDLDAFSPEIIDKDDIYRLKNKLGIDNHFVYGYVGRIVKRKGFSELYEAYCELYEKDEKMKLIVCGKPYSDQIDESIVKNAENHPGVTMTGLIPFEDVPLYMSLFDVFVLPAYWEGFGNVLIQAAAMGIPVISTHATGCKDAVNHGFNGELIEPKNVDELKNKMLFLKKNTELRKKYGRNGLEWSKNFKGEVLWNEMAKIYAT